VFFIATRPRQATSHVGWTRFRAIAQRRDVLPLESSSRSVHSARSSRRRDIERTAILDEESRIDLTTKREIDLDHPRSFALSFRKHEKHLHGSSTGKVVSRSSAKDGATAPTPGRQDRVPSRERNSKFRELEFSWIV
jgi:hypothetical protein